MIPGIYFNLIVLNGLTPEETLSAILAQMDAKYRFVCAS